MKLFNTETRQKEEIVPIEEGKISLYTCGPTVYNFAHIGNFRTYVFEDLLKRSLQFFGFDVQHVMNITDIDDKTITGALEANKTLQEYTQPYTAAFFQDLDTLNIARADAYPHATEFIDKMVGLIEILVDRGFGYKGSDGSVYYRIAQFPTYGRLSHLKLNQLQVGGSERVEADEYDKENAGDFTLWKAYDPDRDGAIFWESPFGKGRPGWHIECSAMAMGLFGDTVDIHVGGIDNMFPHHENEIAQSEACSGKRFVKYWLHSEHLLVDGKKMSKSLGNFYTLRDLLAKGYTGRQVRFLLLSGHYRTPLNFTLKNLDAACASLTRLGDFVQRLKNIDQIEVKLVEEKSIQELLDQTHKSFRVALLDDLNISLALAALFELIRKVHHLCDKKVVGKAQAEKVLAFLQKIDGVLGCIPFEAEQIELPVELLAALEKRELARREKNWTEADRQRDLIAQHGYKIEDTPKGPRLKLTDEHLDERGKHCRENQH